MFSTNFPKNRYEEVVIHREEYDYNNTKTDVESKTKLKQQTVLWLLTDNPARY